MRIFLGLAIEGFGNFDASNRFGTIVPRFQLFANFRPVLFQLLRQFVDGHAVNTRRAFVPADLLQRALQVGTLQYSLQARLGWNGVQLTLRSNHAFIEGVQEA